MAKVTKIIGVLTLIIFTSSAFAKPAKEDTTEYQSRFDKSITFHKVTYLPSVDNVKGIFAKDLDKKLEELIINNHQWDFVKTNIAGSVVRPEEMIGNPENVKSITKHIKADGFFISELRKDPDQTKLHLYLFSALTGELVTEEEVKTPMQTTAGVTNTLARMMEKLKQKIPYDALVISRTDNRVTINAGEADGVRVGQNLTAIKVISANRHPKRRFIIKSNKVLLGQIRIVKADKYLSFGDIQSETEPGVVTEGVKLTGITKVLYKDTPWTKTYTPPEQLLSENNKTVFGKDAQEWIAQDPPTFGKIGGQLALGPFNNSLGFADGTTINAKTSTYPRININGEVWITPKMYTNLMFAQGIGQSSNPSGGNDLSSSLTQYRLSFGYNLLLRNDFFGPKLSFDLGLAGYRMFVDSTNPATGFTTLSYRSVPIGIGGFTKISKSGNWGVGGKAYFHLFPSLTETPISSGDSSNTINEFHIYAENKFTQRLRLKFGLEFMILSSNFSGGGGRTSTSPANSSSHRYTMLTTGIDYLF